MNLDVPALDDAHPLGRHCDTVVASLPVLYAGQIPAQLLRLVDDGCGSRSKDASLDSFSSALNDIDEFAFDIDEIRLEDRWMLPSFPRTRSNNID